MSYKLLKFGTPVHKEISWVLSTNMMRNSILYVKKSSMEQQSCGSFIDYVLSAFFMYFSATEIVTKHQYMLTHFQYL